MLPVRRHAALTRVPPAYTYSSLIHPQAVDCPPSLGYVSLAGPPISCICACIHMWRACNLWSAACRTVLSHSHDVQTLTAGLCMQRTSARLMLLLLLLLLLLQYASGLLLKRRDLMTAYQTLCWVAASSCLSSAGVRLLALGGARSRLAPGGVGTRSARRHVQSSIRCAFHAPRRGCWQPRQPAAAGGVCWAADV